jgi:hypothetical protein
LELQVQSVRFVGQTMFKGAVWACADGERRETSQTSKKNAGVTVRRGQ